MTQYDNSNRGAIWKNEKKDSDKHPDFTGQLNVGGHDYWVSAWKRKPGAPDTAPALSFAVKLKDGKPSAASQPVKRSIQDDMADDIPFLYEWR